MSRSLTCIACFKDLMKDCGTHAYLCSDCAQSQNSNQCPICQKSYEKKRRDQEKVLIRYKHQLFMCRQCAKQLNFPIK